MEEGTNVNALHISVARTKRKEPRQGKVQGKLKFRNNPTCVSRSCRSKSQCFT